MTKKFIVVEAILAVLIAILVSFIIFPKIEKAESEIEVPKVELSHQQDVWISALEWCESNGVMTAINQADTDGTPSYYSFQFKPGTFKAYGEQYGVIGKGYGQLEIMELLKHHDLQREIVENMVHDPAVNWRQQFPGCVRKLGLPPID